MSDRASGGTGGYSPALRAGDFVFVSGQGPLDPQTLAVLGSTVAEQTTHTLRNVLALVEAGGGDASSIVRCTCYLASIDLFDEFTAAYERFFAHERAVQPCLEPTQNSFAGLMWKPPGRGDRVHFHLGLFFLQHG